MVESTIISKGWWTPGHLLATYWLFISVSTVFNFLAFLKVIGESPVWRPGLSCPSVISHNTICQIFMKFSVPVSCKKLNEQSFKKIGSVMVILHSGVQSNFYHYLPYFMAHKGETWCRRFPCTVSGQLWVKLKSVPWKPNVTQGYDWPFAHIFNIFLPNLDKIW